MDAKGPAFYRHLVGAQSMAGIYITCIESLEQSVFCVGSAFPDSLIQPK